VVVPDAAAVEAVERTVEALGRDTHLLAVLDVSGSMSAAPEVEGTTRLGLAADAAAAAALQLFPETAEVGLWSSAEAVPPASDDQERVPLAPLGIAGRAALAEGLAGLQPVPDGGTVLYDTVLAAIRAVRASWDPARVNAVVLPSDGEGTDNYGIGLEELLGTLRQEQADGRQIPVFTIACGTEAGAGPLVAIAEATHGASYRLSDPPASATSSSTPSASARADPSAPQAADGD